MPAVVIFVVVVAVTEAVATATSSGARVLWSWRPASHGVADPVRWRVGVDIG
jgi:hypothetical protein